MNATPVDTLDSDEVGVFDEGGLAAEKYRKEIILPADQYRKDIVSSGYENIEQSGAKYDRRIDDLIKRISSRTGNDVGYNELTHSKAGDEIAAARTKRDTQLKAALDSEEQGKNRTIEDFQDLIDAMVEEYTGQVE